MTAPDQDAKRVVGVQVYGDRRQRYLDPAEFQTPALAAALGDKWVEISREVPGSSSDVLAGLTSFLTNLGSQPHLISGTANFSLAGLRRRHLDAWEAALLQDVKGARSDRPYTKAVNFFTLLRRIDYDDPGLLHHRVSTRLEQPTRLTHRRFEPTESFSPQEVKRLRAACHRIVHQHQRGAGEPTPHLLAALHVLLGLATGEPPEVLRRLEVGDLVATADPRHDPELTGLTPAARLAWLAKRNAVDVYAVTYYKARAHEIKTELYSRHDRSAHRALTALIASTASLRSESGVDSLWLLRRRTGIKQPLWGAPPYNLRALVNRCGIGVAEPAVFTRLRKVVIANEAVADPSRFFLRGRQSPSMFFRHYTNSPVLRAHAGGLLMEGIEGAFNAALAGPMVVTPEAEALLADGQSVDGLDPETGRALAAGELDGPQVACADPTTSPFESPGQICGRSMTGTCFGCPNALITQRHLPAVLAIADIADPSKAADLEAWQQHWKPLYETITRVILPAFPAEAIEAARGLSGAVPVDLGVRNDMRGPDDDR